MLGSTQIARGLERRARLVGRRLLRFSARRDLPLTRNDRRLLRWRDRHRGVPAFVIGTGPSLRIDDLERLPPVVTFACNKIYLAFGQTRLRPTYYSVIDVEVARQNAAVIRGLALTKILPFELYRTLRSGGDETFVDCHLDGASGFCPDPITGDLYGGHTVIFTQLQVAFCMGCSPVYLIGLDHTWQLPGYAADGDLLTAGDEQNHFHDDYRVPGEAWTRPRTAEQERAFASARRYFESHGREIYNATRGGKLEVFERRDLDRVFEELGL